MKTLESRKEIVIGMQVRFAELWDGDGYGQDLLNSGSVSLDNENVVAFEIVEADENVLNTLVRVTDLY